jgi:hypothetical protein
MGKELQDARAALCDLLIGRRFRIRAREFLDAALYLDTLGATDFFILDELLGQAAHCEWLACISERGQVRWGGRLNRCGYQPRHDPADDD